MQMVLFTIILLRKNKKRITFRRRMLRTNNFIRLHRNSKNLIGLYWTGLQDFQDFSRFYRIFHEFIGLKWKLPDFIGFNRTVWYRFYKTHTPSTSIYLHQTTSTYTNLHQPSSTFITLIFNLYQPLPTFTNHHQPPSTLISCHQLSSAFLSFYETMSESGAI